MSTIAQLNQRFASLLDNVRAYGDLISADTLAHAAKNRDTAGITAELYDLARSSYTPTQLRTDAAVISMIIITDGIIPTRF